MDRSLIQFSRVAAVRPAWALSALLLAATSGQVGCGDDDESPADASTRDDAAARDTPKPDAGPDDGEPSPKPEGLRVSISVQGVPPGIEGTQCVKVRLGNRGPIKVNKVHNQLHGQSHHFIVSTVTDPSATEQGLHDCPPFRAPLTGAPLTITQKHDEVITLPAKVGYALGDNQLMHLELHYINTTDKTADVSAESELFPVEDDGTIQEAGFLIVGTMNIAIPPRSKHSTGEIFLAAPPELAGVNYYAVTGHTHRFGTDFDIAVTPSAEGAPMSVYAPSSFDWSAPEVRYFDPPLQIPSGGGFRFQCEWMNTTDQTIVYGESALTEMCFFWAYYYPRSPKQITLIQRR